MRNNPKNFFGFSVLHIACNCLGIEQNSGMKSNCKSLLALILVTGFVVFLATQSVAQTTHDSDFHAANTQAEKTLDAIIKQSETDENMIEYILNRPGYDPSKDNGYSHLFTPALLKAWTDKEANLLRQDCGGKYIDGEICGIDYSPITCGQDIVGGHFYRTLNSSANTTSTVMAATSPQPDSSGAIYRLVRDEEGWKLDGVDCGANIRFNAK